MQEDCEFKDHAGVLGFAAHLLNESIKTTKSGKNLLISAENIPDSATVEGLSLGKWEYVVDEGMRLKRNKPEEEGK